MINTLLIDPRNDDIIYVGSSSDFSAGTYGKLFKSYDGGATWDTLLYGVDPLDIVIHPDSSNILYLALATANFTEPGILKSTDGGMKWFHADEGIILDLETSVSVVASNPKYPDTLYTATGGFFGGSFYMSYNGGLSWINIADLDSIGLDIERFQGGINEIIIDSESTHIVYLGTHWYGDVLKSTDFGCTWQFTGLKDQISVWNLLIDPQNHETIYASSYYGFFKTTDGGINWVNLNEKFEKSFDVFDIISNPAKPSELYISSWENGEAIGGIFKSTDRGEHWEQLDNTFEQKRMRAMAITSDGSNLFIGGSVGLYLSSISTSIINKNPQMIESFQLFQNYPNPFNNSTIIAYKLLSAGNIKLDIYNQNGEKITSLVDRYQKRGVYKIYWNARNSQGTRIPSGIYILKLSITLPDITIHKTKKTIYLK